MADPTAAGNSPVRNDTESQGALNIDVNTLTLADLEDIEGYVGEDVMQMFAQQRMTVKLIVALVWVSKRRVSPDFEIDDARGMSLADVNVDFGGEPTPTGAAG